LAEFKDFSLKGTNVSPCFIKLNLKNLNIPILAEPTNSVLRMTEFLSRARTRIAVVSSVSSSSSTPHPSSSTHPPIPSPDVVGTSNSPKYFKEEFNEENKKNKKIIKKMKIEQEESNNNRNIASIPTLTSPSSEDIENKNSVKRRKMNRVICQQQEEEHNENDENFILPKPRPLRPQQLNVYSLPPPQQQIFLLPSSFPSSSTQQTFYCWPIQQQQPHQQQTLQTQQTHIFTTPTELFLNNSPLNYSLIPLQQQQQQQQHTQKHQQNTNKSPSKNPPINVRHSVQSILGYTIQNLNGNFLKIKKNSKLLIYRKHFLPTKPTTTNKPSFLIHILIS